MSKMQKPTFHSIEPVDFKFVRNDKETDEFAS